jgi:hypothetical protein
VVNINSFTKHRAIALVYIVTPLLWALLSALYPLSANLTLNRRIWGQLAGGSLLALAAHLAIFATLFGTYALGLRRTQRPVWIWLSFGVSAIILLFSFPGESLDIFDYIFRGRMMVEYGASPLTATPYDFRNMPFHRYVTWSQWVDAYGPIWEYVSAAISWVAKQGASAEERAVVINQICATQPAVCTLLTRYVTGYRLMAIALTAICALLIARIAPAETRATALYAFLLNPLTLLTSAVGGHNEALMLVFVLLWVLCFTRRQFALGLLALAAAAHVKFTALLLAPVALLWMLGVCGWRKTLMIVLPVAAIALALSYAAYWPLGGWATLPKNFEQRALLSTNSFGELINLFLFYGLGWEKFAARAPVARVAGVAFALMAGPLLLHWLRRPSADIQDNLRRALGLSMLYLLVGSYWFQPWYALWPLALTACLPGTQWRGREYATLTLTVVAPLAAVLGDYARAQTGVLLLAPWLISSMVVALIFVPTLTSAARAIWPARFRGPQQA